MKPDEEIIDCTGEIYKAKEFYDRVGTKKVHIPFNGCIARLKSVGRIEDGYKVYHNGRKELINDWVI